MAGLEFIPVKSNEDEGHWISVADMMSGLMMVFLFIAIVYINNIGQYFDAVSDAQSRICNDLQVEFAKNIDEWSLQICEEGLVVRFQNESIFPPNDSVPSSEFRAILSSFYPRFMEIIWNNKEDISELRIEGHTSSEGLPQQNLFDAYLHNTELSQDRSRNVMDFVLSLPTILSDEKYMDWAFNNLTAHGLSSSEPILEENIEDRGRSRRVEFRLATTAQDNLAALVEQLNAD
jgi:outer membrane protein OmpA-like peptidoglycan-associated protein